jgi:hypothetical protein
MEVPVPAAQAQLTLDSADATNLDAVTRRFVHARKALITRGLLPAEPRRPIGESWARSVSLGIDPDELHPGFEKDFNDDTRLTRCADVVLAQVVAELSGEPVSVLLTDPEGRILRRRCSDAYLMAALDRAQLDTGYSYNEECVGTNGIGTTVALGVPTLVHGGEHFNEKLVGFACAGAPVHHPLQGTLLGVLDLTILSKHTNPMLLAFARSIAHRIEAELLSDVGSRDLALFGDYLAACRRSGGPVMAISTELVMMNRHAHQRFDGQDRAALLACSQDVADEPSPRTLITELPSGIVARMDYRPSFTGDLLAGGIFRIQTAFAEPASSRGTRRGREPGRVLPALAGTSPSWQRISKAVLGHFDAGDWVILEGETGSGKVALARAGRPPVRTRLPRDRRPRRLAGHARGGARRGRRHRRAAPGRPAARGADPRGGGNPARVPGPLPGGRPALGGGHHGRRAAPGGGGHPADAGVRTHPGDPAAATPPRRPAAAGSGSVATNRARRLAHHVGRRAPPADAVAVARQRRAADPGAAAGVPAAAQRRDRGGRPAAGVPGRQPPPADPDGGAGTGRHRERPDQQRRQQAGRR